MCPSPVGLPHLPSFCTAVVAAMRTEVRLICRRGIVSVSFIFFSSRCRSCWVVQYRYRAIRFRNRIFPFLLLLLLLLFLVRRGKVVRLSTLGVWKPKRTGPDFLDNGVADMFVVG